MAKNKAKITARGRRIWPDATPPNASYPSAKLNARYGLSVQKLIIYHECDQFSISLDH